MTGPGRDEAVPPHEVRYFAVTTAHGPNWDDTRPIRAQEGWEEHAAFLDGLVENGIVVLSGPLDDGEHALLIVDAPSEEDLRRRLAADPWSRAGLLEVGSVSRWRIWLDGRGRATE